MTMVHTMKRLQEDRSLARKAMKRRQYDAAFKRHLVELSLVPGASVAKIALDHRLNANILFKWRRYHLRELARSTPKPAAALLPVTVLEPQGTTVEACTPAQNSPSSRRRHPATQAGGMIEIDLPLARVRLTGLVDLAALRVVIDALSQQ
jgi:transposase